MAVTRRSPLGTTREIFRDSHEVNDTHTKLVDIVSQTSISIPDCPDPYLRPSADSEASPPSTEWLRKASEARRRCSNKPKLIRSRSKDSLVAPGSRRTRGKSALTAPTPSRSFSLSSLRPQQQIAAKPCDQVENVWDYINSFPELQNVPEEDYVEAEDISLDYDGLHHQEIELGSGGQAKIFKGEVNHEEVAIKIARDMAILVEYSLIRELKHPDIVRPVAFSLVFDGESVPLFLACYEYAANGDLATFLTKNPRMHTDRRFMNRFCNSILSALDHIHSKGYIHCDIKPENILVTHDEKVRLADFGMCQPVGPNMMAQGTPSYLAPEIVRVWSETTSSHQFTAAADIFSFGVLLAHTLTGRYPYRRLTARLRAGEEFSQADVAEIFCTPRKLLSEIAQVSPNMADVVAACLHRRPEKRSSAKILKEMLKGSHLGGSPMFTKPSPITSSATGLVQ